MILTPGSGQPNINNPKRNTLQQHTVNLQNSPLHVPNHYPSHNKGPFFLGNNFQAIETTHYLVPKLQPETYVRQLYPYYGPPQYSTNFLTSHPDTKTFPYSYAFPGQKPIRFPPTVAPQLPRRPKVAGLSKEEFAKHQVKRKSMKPNHNQNNLLQCRLCQRNQNWLRKGNQNWQNCLKVSRQQLPVSRLSVSPIQEL